IVRNKVLSKLENEIGLIDNENDYLRNIKTNHSLSDMHDVFKYLHKEKDKGKIELNTNEKKKQNQFQNRNDNRDNNSNNINKISQLDKQKNDLNCLYGESFYDESNLTNNDEEISDDTTDRNNKKKKKKNSKAIKTNLDTNDIYSLKSIIVKLEKELEELKEDNKNINFKYENTFKTLSELRKDTLEYMESIVSRDMRIGYMESMLQKSEKDLSKLKKLYKNEQTINKEMVDKLISDVNILKKQSNYLQSIIQEKDAQNVLLKSDIVRNEVLISQFEARNKELQSELKLMCTNLENVIDVSNKKDIFMNELEKQIRENEVNRQNAYLIEVANNRKAHTNMQFKEMLYEKTAQNDFNALHNLKKELYLNNIHMEKAKHAFEILKNAPKADITMIKTNKNKKLDANDVQCYNNITHNFSDDNNHDNNFENNTINEENPTDVKKIDKNGKKVTHGKMGPATTAKTNKAKTSQN
ncbi:conserved protein, unknown function, partial [Hepatocystis sp. ex Piliocolobus tephrosceles]